MLLRDVVVAFVAMIVVVTEAEADVAPLEEGFPSFSRRDKEAAGTAGVDNAEDDGADAAFRGSFCLFLSSLVAV